MDEVQFLFIGKIVKSSLDACRRWREKIRVNEEMRIEKERRAKREQQRDSEKSEGEKDTARRHS